jgi:hypothetical protein
MVWTGSTEVFMKETSVHASLASFEKGLAPGLKARMLGVKGWHRSL